MRHPYLTVKQPSAPGGEGSVGSSNEGRLHGGDGRVVGISVLLCCAVILRERRLRRGWQRVLERVLQERGTHEEDGVLRSDGPDDAGERLRGVSAAADQRA